MMGRYFSWLVLGMVGIVSNWGYGEAVATFNGDGFWVVDGQPRFILGLYELPKDDAALAAVASAGFDLVCARNREDLDRLAQHQLHGWIPLGSALALPDKDEAAKTALASTVDSLKDHPALLCWEAPDESLWNEFYSPKSWYYEEQPGILREKIKEAAQGQESSEMFRRQNALVDKALDLATRGLWVESEAVFDGVWKALGETQPHPEMAMTHRIRHAAETAQNLSRGWELVWGLDKAHAFWQNHAPRNAVADLREYNARVHAAGCDIYPVPFKGNGHSDLMDQQITAVGAYTERMRAAAPGKACWMVLQGFGWRDLAEPGKEPEDPQFGVRPTFAQTRFMAYDALIHGANAILYWGTMCIEKDSVLWNDLLRVARELRSLEPVVTAPKSPFAPIAVAEKTSASFDGGQPLLMFRQVGAEWVLIAVNEEAGCVPFQVAGLPGELEGRALYRLYSDEEHKVEKGGFRDGMRGLDVHVYATSRMFEVK